MTNQINITALVQTVERLIREVQGTKKTIGAICAEWNRVCHENGIGNCKLATPRKRATLVHELFDVIQVLNLIDPRCDDEGNDTRSWSGESIELNHEEALEEDLRFNWLHNRRCLFHSSSRLQQGRSKRWEPRVLG